MDNTQLERLVRRCPLSRRYFQGVYPCDAPSRLDFPASFIINTDPTDKKGEHWAGVYAPTRTRFLYFDSYGGHPNECILNSLEALGARWITRNQIPFQALTSNVCGYYAVMFIYTVSAGHPLDYMVNMLLRVQQPDLFVKRYVMNKMAH